MVGLGLLLLPTRASQAAQEDEESRWWRTKEFKIEQGVLKPEALPEEIPPEQRPTEQIGPGSDPTLEMPLPETPPQAEQPKESLGPLVLAPVPVEINPGEVRFAIMHRPGKETQSRKVAILLGDLQNKRLEKLLHKQVRVAYISRMPKADRHDVIRYRPGFVQAAAKAATMVPGAQAVEPMTEKELTLVGVDVVIYL